MASKLSTLSLSELYERKITSSVEKLILAKEDFSKGSANWCTKVCKLKHKNPPPLPTLIPDNQVDVLIIQDYKAYDEPKFRKYGFTVEKTNEEIVKYLFKKARGDNTNITFALTRLLKCGLEQEDLVKGKSPSITVLSKCKPYLFQEIEARKPKVIISLSTSVSKVLATGVTNNGNRGEILRTNSGIPLIVTLHPKILVMLRQNSTGAFWGPDFYSVILGDFIKAIKIVTGELEVPNLELGLENARKRITIARTLEEVKVLAEKLLELGIKGRILSYDIEANCLDPYSVDAYGNPAKIILIQFGFRNDEGVIESYVFLMWHRDNDLYDPDDAWEILKEIISMESIHKIGHNIKFDIRFTAVTTGVRPRGILFDTMLLLHAINSGTQGQYSLKQAVWDRLPDLNLGNYEDKLPKLKKITQNIVEEEEENVNSGSDI